MTWSWFSSKKDDLPSYSLLKAIPSRGLPPDLQAREASPEHDEWRDRIEADLFAQPTDERTPNFVTFLKLGNGLLQLRLPGSAEACLLMFSTPFHAADYARVQVPGQEVHYFCSSPEQVVSVIKEFREHAGVKHVTLDLCPRCGVATSLGASNLDSPDKVIQTCKIFKATQIARSSLYYDFALAAAREGKFEIARDVALELVGHVTLEDPRAHMLLGKLALATKDKALLREAQAFLLLLKQNAAVEDLHAAQRAGVTF